MAGRPQRSASVQPVTPGRIRGQAPASSAETRKTAAQLQELDEKKLEGDPLLLSGNAAAGAVSGSVPTFPNEPVPVGDRLHLLRTAEERAGLLIDDENCFGFQSQVLGDAKFRWYTSPSSAPMSLYRIGASHRLLVGGDLGGSSPPRSRLHVRGPYAADHASATGPSSATASEDWGVLVGDATGGVITVTLPPAADCSSRRYHFKRIDGSANAFTIDGDGAETIDGAATKTLVSQWAALEIMSDGTNWVILGQMGTIA